MGCSFSAAEVWNLLASGRSGNDPEIRRLPQGVKKQGHTTAAIGAFAQGVIDLARCDDGVGVGGAHPVDRGADVMIRDGLAVADDHGGTQGQNAARGFNLEKRSEM
jgi:hypothetical protein